MDLLLEPAQGSGPVIVLDSMLMELFTRLLDGKYLLFGYDWLISIEL